MKENLEVKNEDIGKRLDVFIAEKSNELTRSFIKNMIEKEGRNSLYDLTGLSGGFIASPKELSLLLISLLCFPSPQYK